MAVGSHSKVVEVIIHRKSIVHSKIACKCERGVCICLIKLVKHQKYYSEQGHYIYIFFLIYFFSFRGNVNNIGKYMQKNSNIFTCNFTYINLFKKNLFNKFENNKYGCFVSLKSHYIGYKMVSYMDNSVILCNMLEKQSCSNYMGTTHFQWAAKAMTTMQVLS